MLIANPLDSDLFIPAARVLGILFGATLLALLLIYRLNVTRLWQSVLFQRWRTWAVIAPVYGLAMLAGLVPAALLVSALVFQGLREFASLVELPRPYRLVLLGFGLLAVLGATVSIYAFLALPAILLIVATLQPLAYRPPGGVRHLAFAVLGWGYIAWFLCHLLLLHRDVDGGAGILLAVGLAVALSDVGAFAFGTLIGGPKLAPRLSPNKTWAGLAGNIVGAYAGVALMAFALPDGTRWLLLGLLPVIVALGAVWGDLLESSIKREFGAKDAGTWLPGFGGLLDRIDSLLIVVPMTFYVLRIIDLWPPDILGFLS